MKKRLFITNYYCVLEHLTEKCYRVEHGKHRLADNSGIVHLDNNEGFVPCWPVSELVRESDKRKAKRELGKFYYEAICDIICARGYCPVFNAAYFTKHERVCK